MTTITAECVAASEHADSNDRVHTLVLHYPRPIHSEFLTHRVFSKNSASSRAIPVMRMIEAVEKDPFVPLHWGKNQKGMQAGEECSEKVLIGARERLMVSRREAWLIAMDQAVAMAKAFAQAGYHKQIVNRLLEPFSHIRVVVTGSEWNNFFGLRDHPDAEPHMQILAQEIRRAIAEATPIKLRHGEWHLPFVELGDRDGMRVWVESQIDRKDYQGRERGIAFHDARAHKYREGMGRLIRLSAARCASVSYKTVEGFDMTQERAEEIFAKLAGSNPVHASPLEHQVLSDRRNMSGQKWCFPEFHGNLSPFIQYRKLVEATEEESFQLLRKAGVL